MTMMCVSNEPKNLDVAADCRIFQPGMALSCDVAIVREEYGFSAHLGQLPGAISQGETLTEAIDNIREAVRELVFEYRSMGVEIPWSKNEIDGDIISWKRIVVNV